MPVKDKDQPNVETLSQFKAELLKLNAALALPETEHTWEKIEAAIKRFTFGLTHGGVSFGDELLAALREKDTVRYLTNCLITERTRLSGTTLDLLTAVTLLGPSFQPLVNIYVPVVLRLLQRPNKLYLARASACLSALLSNTRLPSILVFLAEGVSDKSATVRKGCADAFLQALSRTKETGGDMRVNREGLEKRVGLEVVEEVIRKTAGDKDVKIREVGRAIWKIYKDEWPQRIDSFAAPLTPTLRKCLNLPLGEGARPRVPSPLKSSRSGPPPALKRSENGRPPALKPVTRPLDRSHGQTRAQLTSSRSASPTKDLKRSQPVSTNRPQPAAARQRTQTAPAIKHASTSSVDTGKLLPPSVMDDLFAPLPQITKAPSITTTVSSASLPPSKPLLKPSSSDLALPAIVTPLPSPLPAELHSQATSKSYFPNNAAPTTGKDVDRQTRISPKLVDVQIAAAIPLPHEVMPESTNGPASRAPIASRPDRAMQNRQPSFKPKRAPGRAVYHPPPPQSSTSLPQQQPLRAVSQPIHALKKSSSMQSLPESDAPAPEVDPPVAAETVQSNSIPDTVQQSNESDLPENATKPFSNGLQSKKESATTASAGHANAKPKAIRSTTAPSTSSFKPKRPDVPFLAKSTSQTSQLSRSESGLTASRSVSVRSDLNTIAGDDDSVKPKERSHLDGNKGRAAAVKKTVSSVSKQAKGQLFSKSTAASELKAKEARMKRKEREARTAKAADTLTVVNEGSQTPKEPANEVGAEVDVQEHTKGFPQDAAIADQIDAGPSTVTKAAAMPLPPSPELENLAVATPSLPSETRMAARPPSRRTPPSVVTHSTPRASPLVLDAVPSPYMKEELYSPCRPAEILKKKTAPLQPKSLNATTVAAPSSQRSKKSSSPEVQSLQFATSAEAFSLPLNAEAISSVAAKVANYERISTGSPSSVSRRLEVFRVADSPVSKSPFLSSPSAVAVERKDSTVWKQQRPSPTKRHQLKGVNRI